MPARTDMLDNIDFEKTIVEFEASNLSKACWPVAFASRIIEETYGVTFIKNEFLEKKKSLDISKIDDPFFIHFSDLLWRLKECKGFNEFIERGKTKSKESQYYEMYCASLLLSISDSVEFRQQSGTKGQDYDLLAKNCMEFEAFPVEVKARNLVFSNESTIQNFLKKAKNQLPANDKTSKCAAIMFKIIDESSNITQDELDNIIMRFISNTSKLSHIIYLIPSNHTLEDGKRVIVFRYRCIEESGIIKDIFPTIIRDKLSYMKDIEAAGFPIE